MGRKWAARGGYPGEKLCDTVRRSVEGSLLLAKHQTVGLLRSLATLRHKILRLGPIEIYLMSSDRSLFKNLPNCNLERNRKKNFG